MAWDVCSLPTFNFSDFAKLFQVPTIIRSAIIIPPCYLFQIFPMNPFDAQKVFFQSNSSHKLCYACHVPCIEVFDTQASLIFWCAKRVARYIWIRFVFSLKSPQVILHTLTTGSTTSRGKMKMEA